MLLRRILTRCRPLVVLLAACLGSSAEPVPSDDDLRILFIGNSLTLANDLPGLVGRLGQAVGCSSWNTPDDSPRKFEGPADAPRSTWCGRRRRNPDLVLFAGDGFHPSGAGTYLAALVIYAQASNRSPIGTSAVARIANLPPGDIEVLEAGASEAIDRFSPP
jgi:hypothetical protein